MAELAGEGRGVLNGIRILELSSFVAAPSAGLTLRQLGAEVIRVDPLGGAPDVHRWPLTGTGRSLYWAGLNRGKASVVLDLKSDGGQRRFVDLLEGGGGSRILITNVAGKAWLDDVRLRERFADLIHVRVLGRRDGSSAVDYTVNAATGLASASGPDDGRPTNNALPAWDLLCGTYAAIAVLAALERRRHTGRGSMATIALDDVAASTLTTLGYLPEAQLTGTSRPALGNAVYGTYGSDMLLRDGQRVMVVALTPRQWKDLITITKAASVVQAVADRLDVDFGQEGVRYEHRHLIDALLRPWFAERDLEGVRRAFAGTSVLWAPFRTLVDHARDLVAGVAEPVVGLTDDVGIGPVLSSRSPIRFAGEAPEPIAPAPVLGQDTERLLETDLRRG